MTRPTIVLSVNSAWNILNFRMPLIEAFTAGGYRVVALAPADGYEQQLIARGVDYIDLPMNQQGTSPVEDARLFLRYRSVLSQVGAACFLGFTVKPNVYGSLAARSLGIPVINNVAGLGTAFIRKNLLTRIVTGLYRQALKRSHIVFFQNPDDRQLFLDLRLVREPQTRLLPGSGIDLQHFEASPPPGGETTTFLYIGRLLWDKGVGELVEAARRLRAESPAARVQLLGVIGANNPTAIPRAIVDDWVREGVVEYLGHCDDVRPHIAAADCVVLPSYREGLPRTLLEAGAMARPLIATDVPGCREIARRGDNAFLCEVRDAASLAQAMARFTATPADGRRAMGRRSRAIVEAEFDQRIVVERYLEAVGEVVRR